MVRLKTRSKKGPISTAEAGRRGGKRTAATHGKSFYEEIGHRGGATVSEKYGPDFFARIGRRGGKRTAATHGKEFYEGIGRMGGEAVSEKYGPKFYAKIGRIGGTRSQIKRSAPSLGRRRRKNPTTH